MKWTMEQLMQLATGYWGSAVLSAAVELELFDAIGRERVPGDDIADRLGLSMPHATRLLDALAGLGLLDKTAVGYAVQAGAAPLLSRSSPTCLLDALKFNTDLYPLWGRLAGCVREGCPAVPPTNHLGGDEARTRRFVLGMHSRAMALAPAVVAAIDVGECRRMLDVGAGPGTFSRLLAERHQGLSITLFDLPPVLAIARELGADSSTAPRISFVEGNYRNNDLPAGFDSVLLCGAIHQESPASAGDLLRKIHGSLEPGGRLFLVDMMLDAGGTRPLFSAFFSINMMLTSPEGRVFIDTELSEMIISAGFADPRCEHLEHSPYWIITATRT